MEPLHLLQEVHKLLQKKESDFLNEIKKIYSDLEKNMDQTADKIGPDSDVVKLKKDELATELRAQGGTPNGTSLLSQEIQKEQKEIPVGNIPKQTQETVSKKYTIDPYREMPE